MAETPKPQNQEAFDKFVKEFNLDPLNKDAINNVLWSLILVQSKQQEELLRQWKLLRHACEYLEIVKEQIDEIAEHTRLPDFQRNWEWFMGGRLIDKCNLKETWTNECNHESDWTIYTSFPPQYRCKKCWEFYNK